MGEQAKLTSRERAQTHTPRTAGHATYLIGPLVHLHSNLLGHFNNPHVAQLRLYGGGIPRGHGSASLTGTDKQKRMQHGGIHRMPDF